MNREPCFKWISLFRTVLCRKKAEIRRLFLREINFQCVNPVWNRLFHSGKDKSELSVDNEFTDIRMLIGFDSYKVSSFRQMLYVDIFYISVKSDCPSQRVSDPNTWIISVDSQKIARRVRIQNNFVSYIFRKIVPMGKIEIQYNRLFFSKPNIGYSDFFIGVFGCFDMIRTFRNVIEPIISVFIGQSLQSGFFYFDQCVCKRVVSCGDLSLQYSPCHFNV